MECNRDDAEKARDLAEEKYKAGDLDGAIRLALKAKTLFPAISGLSQMLAAFYVHLMHRESLLAGEVDWYAILGAKSGASVDTVRRKFRSMCLLTHPDKNKSAAGEEAFKLVNEAWSVLSEEFSYCPRPVRFNVQVKQPSWFSSDDAPIKKESTRGQNNSTSRSSTYGSGGGSSSRSNSDSSFTSSNASYDFTPKESSTRSDAQSGNTERANPKESSNSPTDGANCSRKESDTKPNAQSSDDVSSKQPNSSSNQQNPNTKSEASSKNSRRNSDPPPESSAKSDTKSADKVSSQQRNGGSTPKARTRSPQGSCDSSTTQCGANQGNGSGCSRKESDTKSNAQSSDDHVSPKQPNSRSNQENPDIKYEASSKNSHHNSGCPPESSAKSDATFDNNVSSQKPSGGSTPKASTSNPQGSSFPSTTQSGANQRLSPGRNGQSKKSSTAAHSNSGFPRAKWVAKSDSGQVNSGSAPQSSATSRPQPESGQKSEAKESGPEPSSSPQPNLVCPKCDKECLCVDPCRLAIRCQHCNILALRQVDNGVFGILIGDGTIDIVGGSNVTINIAKVDDVEVEGEANVYITRCDGVNVKGCRSVQLNRCDNFNINRRRNGKGSFS